MADVSTTAGSSPSPPAPALSPSSAASKLTRSALTAHEKALAAVAQSSASRPYTPAAGLTSRRYSTSGVHRMTMTIPISPPPSISSRSHYPTNVSPQSPIGITTGYALPMTPSASTVSGQSRRASLTSSQSVAHAYGFTTATTSTPSRYFPLPSPVDSSGVSRTRSASCGSPTTTGVPKTNTPNLDTIQEVSSSGSGSNSRSGSTVARKGTGAGGPAPITPTGSVRSNHSRAGSTSNKSAASSNNSRRPSLSKASYFHWEAGATPLAIYDPDYPDGTPECLSPRRTSTFTGSSGDEGNQAKDYFSQPTWRNRREDRPHRAHSTAAKTVVSTSSSPTFKDKEALPPTPGDVVSITPSPPTSTKCDDDAPSYLYPEPVETPLSLSEFTLSNNRMGSLDTIFGRVVPDSDPSRNLLGQVPWNEMPQYIRRHNREVERRERERERIVAKDKAAREVKRREKMTITEARLVGGEWKMMDDIPPMLELVQRAGREDEKRMRVRVDGTVELTGIGFLRDLPEEEQRRVLKERNELEMWLRGDVKEKPGFLEEEKEAYERRLLMVDDGENEEVKRLEGRKMQLIEDAKPAANIAPPAVVANKTLTSPGRPPAVVLPATQAEVKVSRLASVAEVDEPAPSPPPVAPTRPPCSSPIRT